MTLPLRPLGHFSASRLRIFNQSRVRQKASNPRSFSIEIAKNGKGTKLIREKVAVGDFLTRFTLDDTYRQLLLADGRDLLLFWTFSLKTGATSKLPVWDFSLSFVKDGYGSVVPVQGLLDHATWLPHLAKWIASPVGVSFSKIREVAFDHQSLGRQTLAFTPLEKNRKA